MSEFAYLYFAILGIAILVFFFLQWRSLVAKKRGSAHFSKIMNDLESMVDEMREARLGDVDSVRPPPRPRPAPLPLSSLKTVAREESSLGDVDSDEFVEIQDWEGEGGMVPIEDAEIQDEEYFENRKAKSISDMTHEDLVEQLFVREEEIDEFVKTVALRVEKKYDKS